MLCFQQGKKALTTIVCLLGNYIGKYKGAEHIQEPLEQLACALHGFPRSMPTRLVPLGGLCGLGRTLGGVGRCSSRALGGSPACLGRRARRDDDGGALFRQSETVKQREQVVRVVVRGDRRARWGQDGLACRL